MLARLAPPSATATGPGAHDVIVERPPPGLARGRYAWPAWGIALVGAALVLLTLVYFLSRVRGKKR
ncbi:MAG TPA: hypothetical protein VGP93_16625 [Polyangiaceae bacterium]|nr:hypothetical protein [Polyangiaceae bacterium]